MRRADKRTLWRTILIASPLAVATGFVAGELSMPPPAPAYSQVREAPSSTVVTPPTTVVVPPVIVTSVPPKPPPVTVAKPPVTVVKPPKTVTVTPSPTETPKVIPVPPVSDFGDTPIPMFTTPPGVG